jgi:putative addiction module component (TIGR02574 family)
VTARAKKLREEALELPKTARAKLAHDLLLSLEDPPFDPPQEVEKAWAAEIDERVRDVKEGRVKLVPVEDAVHDVRASLKRVRAQRTR